MKLYQHPKYTHIVVTSNGRILSYVHPTNGGAYCEELFAVPMVWTATKPGSYRWLLRIWHPWCATLWGLYAERVVFEAYYGRLLRRDRAVNFRNRYSCDIHPRNLTMTYTGKPFKRPGAVELVKAYLRQFPDAPLREIMEATGLARQRVYDGLKALRESRS